MKTVNKLAAVLAVTTGMLTAFAGGAGAAAVKDYKGTQALTLKEIARYDSGKAANSDTGGVEIVYFDHATHKAFAVNGYDQEGAVPSLDIIDLSDLADAGSDGVINYTYTDGKAGPVKRINIRGLKPGFDDVTSVSVHPTRDLVAVAIPDVKPNRGYVAFFDKNGMYLNHVSVGFLPDMLTFTPDGTKVLVANEGEPTPPDSKYDPNGSVSVIDISGDIAALTNDNVTDVDFSAAYLDPKDIDDNVRIFPTKAGEYQNTPNNWVQDFEPEYITVDPALENGKNRYAYISLQESNAIATLDLQTMKYTHISGLGYKNYGLPGNGFDLSKDDDGIHIANWPVLGSYMPDGVASYQVGGKTYVLTANEGDSRADWGFEQDELKVWDLKESGKLKLNAELYGGAYTQQQLDDIVANISKGDAGLSGLKVTTALYEAAKGKGGSPVYDALYTLGARSFSIWDASDISSGPVFDSGDTFEQVLATPEFQKLFNVSNDDVETDDRSTSKGPEPEDVKVGVVDGKPYAFVGLERTGGVMVFDISKPEQSQFVAYTNNRRQDLTDADQLDPRKDDLGPEGMNFVSAENSPTGKPLLLVAHEISGTMLVYEIETKDQAPVQEPKAFTDITSHWARADIEKLASQIVLQGKTANTFAPDEKLTRAELATLLVRALGLEEKAGDPFSDTSDNDWYGGAVAAAYEAKLVSGYEDGTFQPYASITRQELAVMMARALEYAGAGKLGDESATDFADDQAIADWAKAAVALNADIGIVEGRDNGSFVPEANATRAEAAVMLARLLKILNQ